MFNWIWFQGLSEWRDVVARAEDESTGFILPNKTLLEIGILKLIHCDCVTLNLIFITVSGFIETSASVCSVLKLNRCLPPLACYDEL